MGRTLPMDVVGVALTYASRKKGKKTLNLLKALAKTFREIYQNGPAVRAYVDKNTGK
jgi:hypothetical protein